MELINKNIGFAMTGSICTLYLIQFNGLPPSDRVGAKCKFFTPLGCILGA